LRGDPGARHPSEGGELNKETKMKKAFIICSLFVVALGLAACSTCETEPIVTQNQKMIVPPNFGQKPSAN